MMVTAENSGIAPWGRAARPSDPMSNTSPQLTYFDDCGQFAQKHWVIKGVIALGETSGWIAPPGHGKSALLTDIAVHCAAGIDWRGHKSKKPCGVVILALERADLCKRRLHAYRVRNGLADLPIAVHGGIVDLFNQTCVDKIIDIVREADSRFCCKTGLVIIDTFNKGIAAGGGDEDKARDQNRVAANLRRVQEVLGIHLALVGHTGKNETRGARGSNAYLGDVDMMIQISGDIIKTAEITKCNDQEECVLTKFSLAEVTLGFGDDGPISTAIVAADLVDDVPVRKGRDPRLPHVQEILLTALRESKGGLSVTEWNNAAREAGVGTLRRADLTEARNALVTKKLIRERGGLWMITASSY